MKEEITNSKPILANTAAQTVPYSVQKNETEKHTKN